MGIMAKSLQFTTFYSLFSIRKLTFFLFLFFFTGQLSTSIISISAELISDPANNIKHISNIQAKIKKEDQQVESISFKKLNIKSFTTAEQLFIFTTYEVKDNAMKTAYYKALLKKFYNVSEARKWCALTSIHLAMLYIDDQRHPSPQNTRLALQNLELIAKSYPEEKEFCARSLWLCGWIYQDILKKFEPAIPYYQKIIDQYPLLPSNNGSGASWGAISALQILKMSPPDAIDKNLKLMLDKFPSDIATTFAIHYCMTKIKPETFIKIALDHIKSGYHHAIKTCHIVEYAHDVSVDNKNKQIFKKFLIKKYRDYPTQEVQQIINKLGEAVSK